MPADFTGKRVTVMGLGRFSGGVGVARYLVRRGAKVTVTDVAKPDSLSESLAKLDGMPIRYVLGEHRDADFTDADLVVVGPGVPKSSPYPSLARRAGVPLSAEMNLFLAECAGRVVGVTGSNGKSTTTAMIGAALGKRYKTWIGGNIGRSLLDVVDEIGPNDRVALEMSSFQLEDLGSAAPRCPEVAVVTNLTPNHLDRHGSMAEYGEAKKNVFRSQRPADWLVLNADDPVTAPWQAERRGKLGWFSSAHPGCGDLRVWSADDRVWADGLDAAGHTDDWSGPLRLAVPGKHNVANALAALAVALIEGVSAAEAVAALEGYRNLPDRLELVSAVRGVRWYNDSIATTPESVFAALDSFAEEKVCIVGGFNKNLDLSELADRLTRQAKAVVLIGAAADEIQGLLSAPSGAAAVPRDPHDSRVGGFARHPTVVRAGDMEQAVARCAELAVAGDVVLMSPACASFDMFTNYQHRGEVFRRCVRKLAGEG